MFYKSNQIYTENGCISGYMKVENGKICDFLIAADTDEVIDYTGYRIIPGIFDTHNHGTMGYTIMGDVKNKEVHVRGYLKGLASQGVTAVLATADLPFFNTLAQMASLELDGARIIGIHSEGPFLNRVGEKGIDTGHPEITAELLEKMVDEGGGILKLVALAPELPNADEAIAYFKGKGIRVAFAHSNCNYEEAIAAFRKGITVTTHTANVMSGIHHRRMGGLGACILDDYVNNELICDFMHVSKEMIDLILRCKTTDKIMMVSDNTPLSGAPIGRYMLTVNEDNRMAVNIDEKGYCLSDTGRLCGSTKPVLTGIGNLVEQLQIPMETAIQMASLNPARVYGVGDHKGSLAIGKDADFVVIDNAYEACYTYSEGRLIYDSEKDTDLFNQAYLNEIAINEDQ